MARCGCSGSTCGCKVIAGRGVVIRGTGGTTSPYIIDAYPLSLEVQDSSSINLTLTGTGTPGSPFVLSGDMLGPALDGKWKRWSGTQTAYNAIPSKDAGTLYMITGP